MSTIAQNLTVERVATRLHQIFDTLIVIPPEQIKSEDQEERLFRTRAYMALALLHFSDANPTDAAAAITDGPNDGGIDCIYVSEKQKKIVLGQSKFMSNVDGGVSLAEFNRFRDGVKDVINQHWTPTNADLHAYSIKIETMLKDIDTTVTLIFAHNSRQEFSTHVIDSRDKFLNEQNSFEQFIDFDEFRLDLAADVARKKARPENINVQLMLKSWGLRREPYKAVYGAVPAEDVVRIYDEFGQRLFSENLRFGIEKSEVNDGIRNTAKGEPHHFWYFNNGVTAICEDFKKAPVGGQSSETGVFDVTRISVINGAQTVTSLARSVAEGADLKNADVHLRIISLSDTPEDFSTEVTTANNTQNDLSPVDFVAADVNQDRLRREALQLGKVYTYRRGEPEPPEADGFTVRDATIASACASGDLGLAVSAKRYISGLWENTAKEPYTKLFNDDTTAQWLWNAVQIMRCVDGELAEQAKALEGRERLVAVHANRFILFTVFERITLDRDDPKAITHELLNKVQTVTKANLPLIIASVNDLFPEAYPGNVFKNRQRQEEIIAKLKPTDDSTLLL